MHSYKKDLVCTMITISENAAPMTTVGNGSSVQLQEARVLGFSFLNTSDLQHQYDHCKGQSITKRDIFKLILSILTHCLVINIP